MAVGFFDATQGQAPASSEQFRRIAEALMRNSRAPQNVGEGLVAIGDGIVANVMNRRASAAEAAGLESWNSDWAPIEAALGGGFPDAPVDPASAAAASAGGGGDMAAFQNAIAGIESGGRYDIVGPTHPKLGRALGKYQVMEANVGPWTEKHLGQRLTPEQFLASPQAQDAVFNGEFGSYVSKFGPEGAAQAWFAGPGGVGKLGRKDVLGTDVGSYGRKFMKALGGAGVPTTGMTDDLVNRMSPEQAQAVMAASAPQPGPDLSGIDPQSLLQTLPQAGGVPVAENEGDILALEAQMAQADPMAFQGPSGVAQALVPSAAPAVPVQMADASSVIPPMAGGQAPARQGPTLQQLLRAAQNPNAPKGAQGIIKALIEQQMQQQDPRYGLEIENLRGQIGERDRRFDFDREKFDFEREKAARTSDINEYEYARQQGYQGTFAEFQIEQKKAGATNVTTNVGGENLTPGQKKIDEAFADTYLAWNSGGFADSRKQIDQLGEALKILESGENVTGAIGALPAQLAPFFNREGTIARENVEEVVQRSLREILGAQFTEREGERLIARAFNPLLSPQENAKRVRRLMSTIGSMADAKQDMVDYFDENGTLRGYRGSRPTLSQIEKLATEFGESPDEAKGDDLDKLLEMYGD